MQVSGGGGGSDGGWGRPQRNGEGMGCGERKTARKMNGRSIFRNL